MPLAVKPEGTEQAAANVVNVREDEYELVPPPLQIVCTWNSYVVDELNPETFNDDVDEVAFVQVDVPDTRQRTLQPVEPDISFQSNVTEDEVRLSVPKPLGTEHVDAEVVNVTDEE